MFRFILKKPGVIVAIHDVHAIGVDLSQKLLVRFKNEVYESYYHRGCVVYFRPRKHE